MICYFFSIVMELFVSWTCIYISSVKGALAFSQKRCAPPPPVYRYIYQAKQDTNDFRSFYHPHVKKPRIFLLFCKRLYLTEHLILSHLSLFQFRKRNISSFPLLFFERANHGVLYTVQRGFIKSPFLRRPRMNTAHVRILQPPTVSKPVSPSREQDSFMVRTNWQAIYLRAGPKSESYDIARSRKCSI